jgi:hypothetical protein
VLIYTKVVTCTTISIIYFSRKLNKYLCCLERLTSNIGSCCIPKHNSCNPILCFCKMVCKTAIPICKVCNRIYKTRVPKFSWSNLILSSRKIVCIWALPSARAIRCNPRYTHLSRMPSGDFHCYP